MKTVQSQMLSSSVLIIGASITGLSAALAFKRRGIAVTLIERDVLSGEDVDQHKSALLQRRGVPHAMQPHLFLSSLRNSFLDWYPELVDDLLAAGVRDVEITQNMPPSRNKGRSITSVSDRQLTCLASRRQTLETVLRRYVEKQSGIVLLDGTRVLRLLTEDAGPPFKITGVEVERDGRVEKLMTEVVVDASGRTTRLLEPLKAVGAQVKDFHYKSKSAYYSRHYRLRPGMQPPDMVGLPGTLFDDLAIVTFVADQDTFVISIVVNQDDPLLYNRLMSEPIVFEEVLKGFPKAARWIEPERAEPISPVVGWANMDFYWRTICSGDSPQILGYFAAGDTVIRSNPKFGRGCTWGVIGTDILAGVISDEADPEAQILRYEQELDRQFRDDWEVMLAVDQEDQKRFEIAVGFKERNLRSSFLSLLAHWISNIAVAVDPILYREVASGYFGQTSPMAWTKKPSNWLRVFFANIVPNESRKRALFYSRRPSRDEIADILHRHAGESCVSHSKK